MALIHVQLVTPRRRLLDEQVSRLSLPTSLGEITILPGHAPLISDIHSGEMVYELNGEVKSIHIAGGVVEVDAHNQVIMLADEAEHPEEIDVTQVEEARARATKALTETVLSDEEYALTAASLERNLSKLRFVRKHGHRTRRMFEENVN